MLGAKGYPVFEMSMGISRTMVDSAQQKSLILQLTVVNFVRASKWSGLPE